MIDRRTLMTAVGGSAAAVMTGGLESATAAAATTGAMTTPGVANPPPRPDLGFLRTEPLVHAERAFAVMTEEKIDAFVVTQPANVFYLGNHWPNLDRMGFRHSVFVIYPRDPKRPVSLVMTGFLHYYRYADDVDLPNRLVFPYTAPVDASIAEPAAAATRLHRVLDERLITEREKRRRAVSAAAEPPSATADRALAKALRHLGLERARLAIDDPVVERLLQQRGFAGSLIAAEDHLRRIRFAKTSSELRLMRIAAQNNVDAALATIAAVRTAGSTAVLRNRYFGEAAMRGSVPMPVASTSPSWRQASEAAQISSSARVYPVLSLMAAAPSQYVGRGSARMASSPPTCCW